MLHIRLLNQLRSRKILFNTSSQLTTRLISAVVSFTINILVARNLGPLIYGDYIKIISYISLFFLLADFGFNAIFLQKTAGSTSNNEANVKSWWGTVIASRIIISISVMVLSVLILSFLPVGVSDGYTNLVRKGIIYISPLILLHALITTSNAAFQKSLKYHLATRAMLVGSLISLCITFVILVLRPNEYAIYQSIAIFIGLFITTCLSLYYAHAIIPINITINIDKIKTLPLASAPLGLALVLNTIYFRIDSIVITLLRTTQEVGYYGLALRFFEIPLALPTFYMNAIYPKMIHQFKTGEATKSPQLINRSRKILLISSIVLTIVMLFGANMLMFVRPEYRESVKVLQILSLGIPFFFLSSNYMWILIARKKQWSLVPIYFIALILRSILLSVYVPSGGIIAASWTTIICELVILLLLYSTNQRQHNAS